VWDSGRDTLPDLRYARTATTDMHLTRVHPTAIMDLATLPVECSSVPGRGIADTGAGAAASLLAIMAAEAWPTVAATTDGQPTVGAALHAVQWAASVAALAVDFAVQHEEASTVAAVSTAAAVSTVAEDMAADIANDSPS